MVETQLAEDASVRRPPAPRGQRAVGPQASEDITRIGEGTVIEGEVTGGADIVIEGKVDGTIELPNHVLTVGERLSAGLAAPPPARDTFFSGSQEEQP